jgi:hypothetical protein
MSKIYTTSHFVNGSSCSYARLKTYANCARNEVKATSTVAVEPTPPAETEAEYRKRMGTFTPGDGDVVDLTKSGATELPKLVPSIPGGEAREGFYYLDPSPTSLPGGANTGEKNYTPTYNVPNYPPIKTENFSATECGGYRKILNAYGGMSGGNCVTNYINN